MLTFNLDVAVKHVTIANTDIYNPKPTFDLDVAIEVGTTGNQNNSAIIEGELEITPATPITAAKSLANKLDGKKEEIKDDISPDEYEKAKYGM